MGKRGDERKTTSCFEKRNIARDQIRAESEENELTLSRSNVMDARVNYNAHEAYTSMKMVSRRDEAVTSIK